jgi:hypothetical protein
MKQPTLFAVTIAGTCALLFSGCHSVAPQWRELMPWSTTPKVTESTYAQPVRVAAMWTTDILTRPGSPPVRGFGGRLYFYDDHGKTIPVEGQLVVYAYDDTGAIPGNDGKTPNRKFAFTPDQFTEHQSESEFGASYSVWLPWDAVGGDQREISLVPVFSSTMGKIVMGEQSTALLAGRPGAESDALAFQRSARGINGQRDGVDTSYLRTTPSQQQMQTTTINLPESMQRRLALTPPQIAAPQATREIPVQQAAAASPSWNQTATPAAFMAAAIPVANRPFGSQLPGPAAHSEQPRSLAPGSAGEQSGPYAAGLGQHLLARPSGHRFSRPPGRQPILGQARESNATVFQR